jgi:chemotaxis protein methyltransferase WspC
VLPDIEELLKRTMGLDPASIGSAAIARAVHQRLSACDLHDTRDYWKHLRSSETELQELIDVVVVPETWFFRDREAFAALARIACTEWLPTHQSGVLRLLSLPCSTGEEPYTMALALGEAGFPADRFRIDAIDISARALEHARGALYGRNSFRGHDLAFRDRHFTPTTSGYQLADSIRRHVHFRHGNLFSSGFLRDADPYDAIFCRNVLIYFDSATQDRAVTVLARLLTTSGLLFVGAAETNLLLSHGFVSAKIPLACAFRRPGTADEPKTSLPHAVDHPPRRRARSQAAAVRVAVRASVKPATALAVPSVVSPTADGDPIIEAARLADQGRLGEAAELCEQHLRQHGPSADVFHLMGLLGDAAGHHAEAGSYYRKALYLDPTHYQALVHLACVLEKQGDATAARVFRDRARRVEEGARR